MLIILLPPHAAPSGTYEPTDEECDFPDPPPADDEALMFLENATQSLSDQPDDAVAAAAPSAAAADCTSPACGVPHFWLSIFKYGPMFELMVKPADEPALKHLSDIQVSINTVPEMSFQLRFHFTPNAYFADAVLTKEYLVKCEPDGAEPFAFDGPEIYGCRGCTVHWKEGMDLTQRVVRRKGPPADAAAETPNAADVRKTESFFNFFSPPELPANTNHPEYDAINVGVIYDVSLGRIRVQYSFLVHSCTEMPAARFRDWSLPEGAHRAASGSVLHRRERRRFR